MVNIRTPLSALVLAMGMQSLHARIDNQPWMTRLEVDDRGRMFPRRFQRFVWKNSRTMSVGISLMIGIYFGERRRGLVHYAPHPTKPHPYRT